MTADGWYRFVVPLCEGETFHAFDVVEQKTYRLRWRVLKPTRPETRQGSVVLGDAKGFAQQEQALESPLPSAVNLGADVLNGPAIGREIVLDDVPEDLAGTDKVIDLEGRRVSEKEFRKQVTGEYC